MAVRRSAKDGNVEVDLINAVKKHAAKMSLKEIFTVVNDENRQIFQAQNFVTSEEGEDLYKLLVGESVNAMSSML
jgi:hypothetical protein